MNVNRKRSRLPTIEILLADRIIVVQVNEAAEHVNTEGDDLPAASPMSLFNADIAARDLGLLTTPGFRAGFVAWFRSVSAVSSEGLSTGRQGKQMNKARQTYVWIVSEHFPKS